MFSNFLIPYTEKPTETNFHTSVNILTIALHVDFRLISPHARKWWLQDVLCAGKDRAIGQLVVITRGGMELLLYKKVVGNRYRHGGAGCRAKKLTLYAAKDLNHKCRRKSPLCMEEKNPYWEMCGCLPGTLLLSGDRFNTKAKLPKPTQAVVSWGWKNHISLPLFP